MYLSLQRPQQAIRESSGQMNPTQPNVRLGILLVAVAIGVGVMVHLHPEGLHAPAWVAYTGAAAFGLAGLCFIAEALGLRQVNRWLACVLLAVMTVVPGWIGFGAGARQCTVASAGVRSVGSGAGCRVPFGLAAVVCALMFLAALRRALRPEPA
jgi:hypothetical protein